MFVSKNRGNSWTSAGASHFADEELMSYGNTIVVHPANPDHCLLRRRSTCIAHQRRGNLEAVTLLDLVRGRSNMTPTPITTAC